MYTYIFERGVQDFSKGGMDYLKRRNPLRAMLRIIVFTFLGPEIMSKLAGESESNLRKGRTLLHIV